jgi:uncharacterized protein (UPF0335 family)
MSLWRRWKQAWADFEQIAIVVDASPLEQLATRVARLEAEIRTLDEPRSDHRSNAE